MYKTTLDSLPRLLVLGDTPFGNHTGYGVTLSNLFRGWPKDRIAQIYRITEFEADESICANYLLLREGLKGWVRRLPRRVQVVLSLAALRMGIIDIYGFRVQPTRALVWARTFQPNVIFSSPVSVAIARLTIEIARTLAVPFVFHAMDDELGSLARYDPTKERKLAGQLFSEARYSYVISHQMAASYQRRYGVTCEVLANAIDLSNWPTGVSASKQGRRQFVLVYMGAIWKDMQLPSFADICDAVAQLATEGWPVELQIYTHRMFEERYRAKLERIPSVCFCGSKPYDEIPSSLAGADLLILPVTFDSQALVFTRDSMPTKIPEYMASGTAVLLYGPAEAAPIAYARDQGWGHVVTEQGVGNVKQAILELLSDPAKRMAYATRARELAEQNHNLEIVRPRLWERLCRVAAEISGHAN